MFNFRDSQSDCEYLNKKTPPKNQKPDASKLNGSAADFVPGTAVSGAVSAQQQQPVQQIAMQTLVTPDGQYWQVPVAGVAAGPVAGPVAAVGAGAGTRLPGQQVFTQTIQQVGAVQPELAQVLFGVQQQQVGASVSGPSADSSGPSSGEKKDASSGDKKGVEKSGEGSLSTSSSKEASDTKAESSAGASKESASQKESAQASKESQPSGSSSQPAGVSQPAAQAQNPIAGAQPQFVQCGVNQWGQPVIQIHGAQALVNGAQFLTQQGAVQMCTPQQQFLLQNQMYIAQSSAQGMQQGVVAGAVAGAANAQQMQQLQSQMQHMYPSGSQVSGYPVVGAQGATLTAHDSNQPAAIALTAASGANGPAGPAAGPGGPTGAAAASWQAGANGEGNPQSGQPSLVNSPAVAPSNNPYTNFNGTSSTMSYTGQNWEVIMQ